jgi:protein involved in polysaccharide export with SLBB domain
VQDYSQFSGRFIVKENGTIDYPLLPDVPVTNLSVAELISDLTYRLAKHVENPLVWITIVDKPEITVTVLGGILKPGPVVTYLGSSVQEVIAAAGGVQPQADIERIKIIHRGGGDADAVYFDFKEFLRNGQYDMLPALADGDVVILCAQSRDNKVKVIGAVNKPGFYDLEQNMNVFELVYLAGGPAEKADLSRVRRFYKIDDKTMEETLNLQSYLDRGKLDEIPLVQEGDVIIIYSRWFNWPMMLTILTNILLFVVTIQSLRGALN